MIVIQAKDFNNREELENKVRSSTGLTADLKPDVEIRGKRVELERLRLSDRTTFWGIRCIITDEPTSVNSQISIEKPLRGELQDFSINKINSKKPK